MTLNYTVYMSRLAFIMMALLVSELAFSAEKPDMSYVFQDSSDPVLTQRTLVLACIMTRCSPGNAELIWCALHHCARVQAAQKNGDADVLALQEKAEKYWIDLNRSEKFQRLWKEYSPQYPLPEEVLAPPVSEPPTPTAGATGTIAKLQLEVPISFGPAPADLEFPPYGLRQMRQRKKQLLCWLNRARGRLSVENKAKRVCQQTSDDAQG